MLIFVLHLNTAYLLFCSYRLADHPRLSSEFTKHLKRLPPSLNTVQNKALYRRLIDTYGTHYIHQVSNLSHYLVDKKKLSLLKQFGTQVKLELLCVYFLFLGAAWG